jgi:hypothetical protein
MSAMRSVCVAGLLGVSMLACSAASTGNAAFDEKWAALEMQGGSPVIVQGGEGRALLGEVREAVGTPEGSAEPAAAEATPLEGALPDSAVSSVVKRNVRAVGSCFQLAAREGSGQGGKAIVSLNIGTEGRVTEVNVEAPAFEGTSLPGCVQSRAKSWAFPKFTEGPKQASFPLVFAGQ